MAGCLDLCVFVCEHRSEFGMIYVSNGGFMKE